MALSEITQLLTGKLVLPAKEVMNQLQDIEKQDIKQNSELKQLNYTAKEILKYLKPSLDDLEARLEKNKMSPAAATAAASAARNGGEIPGGGLGGGLGSIIGGLLAGAGGGALLNRFRSAARRSPLRPIRPTANTRGTSTRPTTRGGSSGGRTVPRGPAGAPEVVKPTGAAEVKPVITQDPVRGPVIAEEPVIWTRTEPTVSNPTTAVEGKAPVGRVEPTVSNPTTAVEGKAPVVMSEGPVMSSANSIADDAVRIRPVWDDALGRWRNPTTGRIIPTAMAEELIMAAEATRPAARPTTNPQLVATREAPPRPTNSRGGGGLYAEQRFFAEAEASLGSRMTGMARAGASRFVGGLLGLPGLVAQLALSPSEIALDPQEQLNAWTMRQFEERGVGAIDDVLDMLSAYAQVEPDTLAMSGVGHLLSMSGEELRELAKSTYRMGSNPNYTSPSIAYSDTNVFGRDIRDYTTDAEGFALSPDAIRSKLRADAERVAGGAFANGGIVVNNINNNGGGNSAPVVIPPAQSMPSTTDNRFASN